MLLHVLHLEMRVDLGHHFIGNFAFLAVPAYGVYMSDMVYILLRSVY